MYCKKYILSLINHFTNTGYDLVIHFQNNKNKTIIQTIKYYESILTAIIFTMFTVCFMHRNQKYSLNLIMKVEGWITMNLESKIGILLDQQKIVMLL
jgi:hypothetical protein